MPSLKTAGSSRHWQGAYQPGGSTRRRLGGLMPTGMPPCVVWPIAMPLGVAEPPSVGCFGSCLSRFPCWLATATSAGGTSIAAAGVEATGRCVAAASGVVAAAAVSGLRVPPSPRALVDCPGRRRGALLCTAGAGGCVVEHEPADTQCAAGAAYQTPTRSTRRIREAHIRKLAHWAGVAQKSIAYNGGRQAAVVKDNYKGRGGSARGACADHAPRTQKAPQHFGRIE